MHTCLSCLSSVCLEMKSDHELRYEARDVDGPSNRFHHLGMFSRPFSLNTPYYFPTGQKKTNVTLKKLRLMSQLSSKKVTNYTVLHSLTSPTHIPVLFSHIHMKSLCHPSFQLLSLLGLYVPESCHWGSRLTWRVGFLSVTQRRKKMETGTVMQTYQEWDKREG